MAQHPPQPHVHAQIMPLLLMEGNNRYVLIPNTLPEAGIVGETHDCMAIPCRRYAVNQVHQPIFQTAYRKPMNDMHHERGLHVPRLYSVGHRHTGIRIYDHVHTNTCPLTQWLVQQPSHVTVLPGVRCVRPTGGAPARSVGPVIHIGVARRGPQAGSRGRLRKRADSPLDVPHLSWSPTCLAAPRVSPRLAAP